MEKISSSGSCPGDTSSVFLMKLALDTGSVFLRKLAWYSSSVFLRKLAWITGSIFLLWQGRLQGPLREGHRTESLKVIGSLARTCKDWIPCMEIDA